MRTDLPRLRSVAATAFLALAAGIAFGVGGVREQQAKLTADDPANGDQLGSSVALDGETAVVGAPLKNGAQGAVYVFERTGRIWTEAAKLTAADPAPSDYFGHSVALDGDTAVVGANSKSVAKGAVYVFRRSGTVWTQEAKLTASDALNNDYFGESVAVSGDTVVVGAYLRSSQRGAAYVFTRTGTTWTQETKIAPADAANGDSFGFSVALSGETAVIGAPGKFDGRGTAYVFRRSGTTWSEETKLAGADAATGDQTGYSVALAGETAVVGAPWKNAYRGAAYVFTRAGSTWSEQAKLTASDAVAADTFGTSVAFSGDAAVIGAPQKDANQGAAYVFTRTGIVWTEGARLAAADEAAGDKFGEAVAFSGGTALAGARAKDASRGAAYVFTGEPAGWCVATKVKAKVNAAHPEKSSLTVSGALDTGAGVPDFSGAATFDAGGFHLDVPAFVARGRSLTFGADGVTLTITPARNGSSHGTFVLKVVGDLTGKVDPDGQLVLRFTNIAHDLRGTVALTSGGLAPHGVLAPALAVLGAAATVKDGGADAFAVTVSFATDGIVPVAAEDLTIGFGGFTSAPLLGATFVRKGDAYVRTAKAPGVTKTTVDYAKGTITVAAAGVELGDFTTGGNAVVVTIARGADTRSAGIRMVRAGSKLSY